MCGVICFCLTSQARVSAKPYAVGDEIIRLQAETLFRALQHRSRSADLGLPDGACRFDVDNHSLIRVDQIILVA